MKTLEELKVFYQDVLMPDLLALEAVRKQKASQTGLFCGPVFLFFYFHGGYFMAERF